MGAPMWRVELNRYVDGLLELSRFRDYCPNRLLVEGQVVKSAARALRCSSRMSSICSPGRRRWMPIPYRAMTRNSPCGLAIAIFFR